MNPKKPRNKCLRCGSETKRLSAVFCSSACSAMRRRDDFIDRWKDGPEDGLRGTSGSLSNYIHSYLRLKYGNRCSRCGWSEINKTTNRVPLTVEHIDGDWRNNKEDNLDLICPNCHSLTSTYGILNRGRGRPFRH